jgi:acetylglutamate kinase
VTGRPVVVKFGGELLEQPDRLSTAVKAMVRVAGRVPLAIVHGGGKEIDAALNAAGIEKRQVDGLRITDAATLDVVVGVLAGSINTRLVAALGAAGLRAVGLTGADGSCGLSDIAPPHRSVDGRTVDLGRVGIPSHAADVALVRALLEGRFVPVIASIGVTAEGQLLNVNADTFAGRLAERLEARRLVVAGTTAGVLDDRGATVAVLELADIQRLIGSGTATAGMIAKLRACEGALANGVDEVVIVDGRDAAALEAAALDRAPSNATRIELGVRS